MRWRVYARAYSLKVALQTTGHLRYWPKTTNARRAYTFAGEHAVAEAFDKSKTGFRPVDPV